MTLVFLLWLGACGGGSPSDDPARDESTPPSSAAGPRCDETWVVGTRLPQGYDGCSDDQEREALNLPCGDRTLHTFADEFWALSAGEIRRARGGLRGNVAFRTAALDCEAK